MKEIEVDPEHLRISLAIQLGKIDFTVRAKRLTEDQRDLIARAIVQHMRVCKWRVVYEDVPGNSSSLHQGNRWGD